MNRICMLFGAIHGLLGVGLGAFGAHGLKRMLSDSSDASIILGWWDTAARYQLIHAVLLVCLAQIVTLPKWHAWIFMVGTTIFSGTLYAMSLGAPRWFGAITPIGGTCLLVGWAGLCWFAFSSR